MDAVLDMLGHVPQVLVGSVLASAGFLLSVLAPIVTYYLPTLRSDVPALLQQHKLALERKDNKQQQQQRESEKPAESVHSADSSDTAHSTDSSATLYPSTDNDSRELSPRSPSEPPDLPKTPVASKSKFPQCVVKKRKSAPRSLTLPSTSSPSSPVSKPPRSPPPPLPLPPASANVWRTELSPIEDSALALDPDHARGRDAEAVHTAKTTGTPDNSGSAAVAQEKIPRRRSMKDLCREKRRERKLKRSLSTPLPPPLPSPSSSSVALPADGPQPEAKSARRKTPFLHPTRSPKHSNAKLPPARTQPYAAPYFFPSPGSAEATDYVKLVKDERRGLQQQNGTILHQRHQVQSLSPCHISSPLSASHPRRVASEDLGSPTRLVESPEMEHAPPPPAARVTVEEPAAFLRPQRPGRTAAERQSWAGSTDAMETKDAAAAAKASPSRPLFKRLAKSHV